MPKLSGNKGEWSEIYVFLRLLEVGKLYAADADLNKMDDVFYNIINIVRTENIGVLEFRVDRNAGRVSVYNTETTETMIDLPSDEFARVADKLYTEIVAANASNHARRPYGLPLNTGIPYIPPEEVSALNMRKHLAEMCSIVKKEMVKIINK